MGKGRPGMDERAKDHIIRDFLEENWLEEIRE